MSYGSVFSHLLPRYTHSKAYLTCCNRWSTGYYCYYYYNHYMICASPMNFGPYKSSISLYSIFPYKSVQHKPSSSRPVPSFLGNINNLLSRSHRFTIVFNHLNTCIMQSLSFPIFQVCQHICHFFFTDWYQFILSDALRTVAPVPSVVSWTCLSSFTLNSFSK